MTTNDDTLRRLRVLACVEGSSLLLLVAIAVPLKHLLGLPLAVSIMGPLHGIAFLAYAVTIVDALGTRQLTGRGAGAALVAALIPGGSFLFARSISRVCSGTGRTAPGPTQDRRAGHDPKRGPASP